MSGVEGLRTNGVEALRITGVEGLTVSRDFAPTGRLSHAVPFRTLRTAIVLIVVAAPAAGQSPAVHERIAEIRVHGNHSIPEVEVLSLAGIAVDDRILPDTVDLVTVRLVKTGRFDSVDVRKRYRSLEATSDVVLMIVVHERPSPGRGGLVMAGLRRLGRQSMVSPIIAYDEGYGFSYGARASFVDALGSRARLSVPVAWGAIRRASAEVERSFDRRWLSTLRGHASVSRNEHPHFDIAERRIDLRMTAERQLAGGVDLAAHAARTDVVFGGVDERFAAYGGSVSLRLGARSAFPRDAFVARVGWERMDWLNVARPSATRIDLDLRGFKKLVGQSVLAVRSLYRSADRPLPAYEQALLGGAATLRGSRVGMAVGDRLTAGSVELRLPLDSPLSIGAAGVSLFGNIGAVTSAGRSFTDVAFPEGGGIGLFFTAPFVRLQLDVAHDFEGAVRAHISAGLRF